MWLACTYNRIIRDRHADSLFAQDIAIADSNNDLRAQLALAITPHRNSNQGYTDGLAQSDSSSSQQNNRLIVAGAGGQDMMSGSAGDSGDEDGRKGGSKRELSQSKRAAQNRAAQRAFRQRKEGYIKKLEEQVRELHTLENNYKAIQTENYSLREYIIHLQSRLIESHGEYPPAPANVNLNHPHHHHSSHQSAPQGSSSQGAGPSASHQSGGELARRAAAAVAEQGKSSSADHEAESLEQRALSRLQASAAQAVAAGEGRGDGRA